MLIAGSREKCERIGARSAIAGARKELEPKVPELARMGFLSRNPSNQANPNLAGTLSRET